MPNEINQELVKAFNIILAFDKTAITNLTLESIKRSFLSTKDHVVISFDKDMNISQRMKYLNNMKERMVKNFCGDESDADKLFDTNFFPLSFDKRKWKDNKFLVPMKDEVVYNLKYLLANNLVQFTVNTIMEDYSDPDYVEENISEEICNRNSYLHCICFDDQKLQNSFVELLSSEIKNYKNGPERTKDFLEIKKNRVYIKKDIFDNPKFIKDIVKDRVSLACRGFRTSRNEDGRTALKFAVVDLIREALPGIPIYDIWHTSHTESENEYSMLAPVIDHGEYMGFLSEREVNHINNEVFGGTEVLCDLKDYIAQKGLPTYGSKKIYAIDFANIDISYCVMNKVIETSVINKGHELSIDPERVPKLYCSPPRTPPQGDRDSGLGDSPPKSKDEDYAECSSSSNSPEKIPISFERTPLTASQRSELRPFLSPELQKKLDSNTLENAHHLYLTHTPGGKHELSKSFETKESQLSRLANAQLTASSKSSEKDSGFCSSSSSGLRSSFMHKNPGPELEKCSIRTCLDNEKAFE